MPLRRLTVALIAAASGLLLPSGALAHGGFPAVAWLNEPEGVGVVADESFSFTWIDNEIPIPTGTSTVDFFYARRRPPTFLLGDLPEGLEGEAIVRGIPEPDRTNRFTWDTRAVPAGSYLIWSIVTEPPMEVASPQYIAFSPGVLTVAHPGDDLHPAIVITEPSSPFRFADERFEVRWAVFDPERSGMVRIEAGLTGEPLGMLFEGAVTSSVGALLWDTRALPEGDYALRATITDARGLSFTNWSRHFLLITHVEPRPDAGVDAGEVRTLMDAGQGPLDAGTTLPGSEPEGCGCGHTRAPAALPALSLLGGLALLRRRR